MDGSFSNIFVGYREALLLDSYHTLIEEVMSLSTFETLMIVFTVIGLLISMVHKR